MEGEINFESRNGEAKECDERKEETEKEQSGTKGLKQEMDGKKKIKKGRGNPEKERAKVCNKEK